MNLRILKKLSKRAAPLLPLLGDDREQFRAVKFENYTGQVIMDRKHWERGRSVHGDLIQQHEIKTPAKDGKGWVYAAPPAHPREGTIMVGCVSGYYEPEWDEETAWEALETIVRAEFLESDWESEDFYLTRTLSCPSEIFAAAADLIAEGARP